MATLQAELKKLLPNQRKNGRLGAAQDREPIPGGQGEGLRESTNQVSTISGGGVDWPLTETPATRTLHPINVITSSDGLFVWEYQHVDQITFTDAGSVNLEDG